MIIKAIDDKTLKAISKSNQRNATTLLKTKDFCEWIAYRFIDIPESFKKAARIVLLGAKQGAHKRYQKFGEDRELVLKTAIILLAEEVESHRKKIKMPSLTAKEIQDRIEQAVLLDNGCPPDLLQSRTMMDLLGPLIKDGKKKLRS